MKNTQTLPWTFLDEYRNSVFSGEWPTLPELFSITASRFPERPCFTVFEPERVTLTYNQALKTIKELSQWMLSKGLKSGDRVAVSGKNSPEWAVTYLATLFAGGIVVPIDYGLHEKEAENLLSVAKPKLLFVDEEKYQHFSQKKDGYETFSLSKKNQDTYVYNLKTNKSFEATLPKETDLAAILFTSGTTGTPKGVMLSHKNLVSDCFIAQLKMPLFETDVFYAILPIHHAYTMLAVFIETISVGAEVVFGKSMAVSKLMMELREGKITMLLGVPLLFNKLLAGIIKGIKAKGPIVYGIIRFLMGISYIIKKVLHVNPGKKMFASILKKASISTIRVAICGAGPLAPSVFKMYNEFGIDFVQGYGLTETSPIITLNPVNHFKIESVGQYFAPYMEMRIENPDERGIGEVQVKGPMVMQGYYQLPEETAAVFTQDGWFKTGDLGYLDGESYLMLAGRAKNMIVTEGGKNVFPEEIENMFQLCTDIEQITVQGYIENQNMKSEAIEALVYPADTLYEKLGLAREKTPAPAVTDAIQAIITSMNKDLPSYSKITKLTILSEPLEMTTTKKVKRNYKK